MADGKDQQNGNKTGEQAKQNQLSDGNVAQVENVAPTVDVAPSENVAPVGSSHPTEAPQVIYIYNPNVIESGTWIWAQQQYQGLFSAPAPMPYNQPVQPPQQQFVPPPTAHYQLQQNAQQEQLNWNQEQPLPYDQLMGPAPQPAPNPEGQGTGWRRGVPEVSPFLFLVGGEMLNTLGWSERSIRGRLNEMLRNNENCFEKTLAKLDKLQPMNRTAWENITEIRMFLLKLDNKEIPLDPNTCDTDYDVDNSHQRYDNSHQGHSGYPSFNGNHQRRRKAKWNQKFGTGLVWRVERPRKKPFHMRRAYYNKYSYHAPPYPRAPGKTWREVLSGPRAKIPQLMNVPISGPSTSYQRAPNGRYQRYGRGRLAARYQNENKRSNTSRRETSTQTDASSVRDVQTAHGRVETPVASTEPVATVTPVDSKPMVTAATVTDPVIDQADPTAPITPAAQEAPVSDPMAREVLAVTAASSSKASVSPLPPQWEDTELDTETSESSGKSSPTKMSYSAVVQNVAQPKFIKLPKQKGPIVKSTRTLEPTGEGSLSFSIPIADLSTGKEPFGSSRQRFQKRAGHTKQVLKQKIDEVEKIDLILEDSSDSSRESIKRKDPPSDSSFDAPQTSSQPPAKKGKTSLEKEVSGQSSQRPGTSIMDPARRTRREKQLAALWEKHHPPVELEPDLSDGCPANLPEFSMESLQQTLGRYLKRHEDHRSTRKKNSQFLTALELSMVNDFWKLRSKFDSLKKKDDLVTLFWGERLAHYLDEEVDISDNRRTLFLRFVEILLNAASNPILQCDAFILSKMLEGGTERIDDLAKEYFTMIFHFNPQVHE